MYYSLFIYTINNFIWQSVWVLERQCHLKSNLSNVKILFVLYPTAKWRRSTERKMGHTPTLVCLSRDLWLSQQVSDLCDLKSIFAQTVLVQKNDNKEENYECSLYVTSSLKYTKQSPRHLLNRLFIFITN